MTDKNMKIIIKIAIAIVLFSLLAAVVVPFIV